MKTLLIIASLAFAGCATLRKPVSVARVAAPIERADVVAIQSRARVTKVQAKITTAKDAVNVLRKTATAEQWLAIDKIDLSLVESTRLLNEELEQNEILTISLNMARDALTDVLLEQERIMKELETAEKKAAAYTALVLKIALAAALLAAWLMWQFLPGFLGPCKWWAVAGVGVAAFGATYAIL